MRHPMDILQERGFVKQVVFPEKLYELLKNESVVFYAGFDPTADSLHIGHYIPVMAACHLQRAGHKPIALMGGATALVGDPSFRNDMRQMLSREQIKDNVASIKKQMQRFLSFEGDNAAVIVDNADWTEQLTYIDFIRDIGVHFSVNRMLTADCFKQRMESGLSFLEFNYMLMQAYDYLHLYKTHNCKLEIGGNDQWSNILAGADLVRRVEGDEVYALTVPLLENSQGQKMGKTQKGALWLDATKTSPYEFYQYFRNVDDADVENCLKMLTFLPLEEIGELVKHKDERINAAKRRLALEVTCLIHGEVEAENADKQAQAAFSGNASDMPCVKIPSNKDKLIVDLLCDAKVCASKSEVRRLIDGKAIRIGEQVLTDYNKTIADFADSTNSLIVHRGKKVHLKIEY